MRKASRLLIALVILLSGTILAPYAAFSSEQFGWQQFASAYTYNVSGSIYDGDSNPIPDVVISDGIGHTVVTDSSGHYALGGLDAGTYTLTPSKSGYAFSPASRIVTLPPDEGNQNFIGTPTTGAEILDQFQTGVNYGFWFEDDVIRWQEFIPELDNITSVEVFIDKRGSPGDVIIEIQTMDGSILAQEVIAESDAPAYGWAKAEFGTPVSVSPGTKYRIYVYSDTDSPSPDNRYFWRGNTASTYCPTCDTDVSGGWTDYDYAFKTFGAASAYQASATYVYNTDLTTANEFNTLLTQNGILVSLVQIDNLASVDFSNNDVILVGDDTGYLSNWGDTNAVNILNQSGKPLVGLGEGGYAFFGQLGLDIGYPYGWHGTHTDIYAVDPSQIVYDSPYVIDIPSDRILDLYTTSNHVGIYLPDPSEDVRLIGREAQNLTHYALVQQSERYLLWGFDGAPSSMSEVGKNLLINMLNSLIVDTYTVSGEVKDGGDNPVPGVTISDGAGHSATTDSSGAYVFEGLPAGTYTLIPNKNGYDFSPDLHMVTVPPDATAQNFTATPTSTLETDLYVLTDNGILRTSMTGEKQVIVGAYGESYSFELSFDKLYVSNSTRGGDILVYDLEGNYLQTIPTPSEADQYLDFVVLPDGNIALLDNSNDKVFFINSMGSLLATTDILDPSDSELQNLDGVVVDNRLILSENGQNYLVQIDLSTYTRSVFKDLTSLPHWLGAITYADGQYYVCGPQKIYAFTESTSAVEVAEIPENNITGIVVIDNFAYVSVNFAGKIYKVDLNDGTSSVVTSYLSYPKDLEYRAEKTANPDIRIVPSSLSFDLSSMATRAQSQLPSTLSDTVDFHIVQSDDATLILDLEVPEAGFSKVQVGQEIYHRLSLPGEGFINEIGRPQLPALRRWLAVPTGKDATVQVLDSAYAVKSGYNIYPAQEPRPDQGGVEPEFSMDADFYERDNLYPQPLVVLDRPVDWRGTQAALLHIYPHQYNPATGDLRVYSHVRVKINFAASARSGTTSAGKQSSPYLDDMYRTLLLNYDETVSHTPSPQSAQQSTEGADFLIITAPAFESAANALAEWRNQQGMVTKVRTTDETGTTADEIQSYIQDAYNNWSPAPSFLLLLGDAEFIPPHYQTTHPYHYTTLGTDLYYATLGGPDYFPDIALGRIPVDTATQAEKIINDIIEYERNPVNDDSFYDQVAMAAYFQDNDPRDGYSDRRFVLTSEEIRDFLVAQGYSVERIYSALSSVNPTHYNNGFYANGNQLSSSLLRANGFAWDGDSMNVTGAVNNGVFLLNHRDHGSFSGWGHPSFSVSDVGNLSNNDELPIVFSINCQTGWFDNETDEPSDGTGHNDITFAEAWQRNPNGGAVGVVAATRVSYSGHNDALVKGFYDAIWPDFLPYTPSPGTFSNPQRRMGNVLNYGKLYYASQYGDSLTRQVEFEEFHYFGDPTTQIWTAPPSQSQKTFTIYNDGDADLIVSEITKQDNSCWLNTVTDFPLTIPPDASEDIIVKISASCASAGTSSDRLLIYSNDSDENPYPSGVDVALTVPEVNELVYDDSSVDTDSGGNEDGIVNPGEVVSMSVNLRNMGSGVATDVSAVLSTTSSYVNILDGEVFYSAVGEEGPLLESEKGFSYEVLSTAPGNSVIFFNLSIDASNGGPWEEEFAVVVAPDTTTPYVPSSPSPSIGAIEQPTEVSLTWSGGDPDGDEVTYDVYVSTDHPFQDLEEPSLGCFGITTPVCDLELDASTRYFWYVVATDEHNATVSSPVWDFATETANQIFLPLVLRQ